MPGLFVALCRGPSDAERADESEKVGRCSEKKGLWPRRDGSVSVKLADRLARKFTWLVPYPSDWAMEADRTEPEDVRSLNIPQIEGWDQRKK